MIRGAQRNMIVLKTAQSQFFEEAHFFVRRDVDAKNFDLLSEANKIVEGCDIGNGERPRRRKSISANALIFSFGLVLGGFLTMLLVFFC